MPLITRPQCTPAPPTGWLGWAITLLGGSAVIAASVVWYLHAPPVGPRTAGAVSDSPRALSPPVPLTAGKVIEPDDPPAAVRRLREPAPALVGD